MKSCYLRISLLALLLFLVIVGTVSFSTTQCRRQYKRTHRQRTTGNILYLFRSTLSIIPAATIIRPQHQNCRTNDIANNNRYRLNVNQYTCDGRVETRVGLNPDDDNDIDKQNDKDDIRNAIVDSIDAVINILLKPIPFLGDTSIGIISLLTLDAILQPLPQSIITLTLFTVFSNIGKKIILFDEEEDEDRILPDTIETQKSELQNSLGPNPLQIDFLSFIFSFFAAGLISPDLPVSNTIGANWNNFDNISISLVVLLLVLLIAGLYNVIQQMELTDQRIVSPDEKLLNRWDRKFRNQQKRRSNNDDDE